MTWSANDIKNTGESRALHFRDALKRYEAARTDARRDQRIASHECLFCFYFGHGMAGQAMTEYTCKGCDKEQMHGNTAVPKLCASCAKDMDACRRCGGQFAWPGPKPEIRKPRLIPTTFPSGDGYVVYKNDWGGTSRIGIIVQHTHEAAWCWQFDTPKGKRKVAGSAVDKDQAVTRLMLASIGCQVPEPGGRQRAPRRRSSK